MSTAHQFLSGTLISDPISGITPRGTPGVKFTLRAEAENEEAAALAFWCFIADLWPTLLGCRKGDALSLIGGMHKRSGIRGETDFTVRRVLSIRKQSIRTLHEPDLPEAA